MRNQCGVKTKSGESCRSRAMANGRCRMHGGKTPRGLALPQTTHGRYSKDLPTRLLADYERALQDSDLLELRSEIALLDSRLSDLLQRVDTGEAGALWKQLNHLYDDFIEASRREDRSTANRALVSMQDIIQRGRDDYAAWDEVKAVIEDRRRLVETERKRMLDMQLMVRSDRFMLFVTALASSVKKHIKDRDTLAAISRDIAEIAASGLA